MSSDDYPQRKPQNFRDTFTAKFPGECFACSGPITPGQQIVGWWYKSRSGKTRGFSGPYVHAACEEVKS